MKYVDGFVIPVPKKNLEAYKNLASQAGTIWKEHGALEYIECMGDDIQQGKVTSFPLSVNLQENEIVIFAWIIYNSREHRDEVNARVMSDPRMKPMMDMKALPFDGQRMIWGGFKMMLAF